MKPTSQGDGNGICQAANDWWIYPLWSISNVCLIVLTWRLWFPGYTKFPRVPLFGELDSVFWALAIGAAILIVAGYVIVASRLGIRFGMALVGCGLGIAFVCNQHCLQPWAWQAFIISILLALLPESSARVWIGRLIISIYLFSAIGKFDYQFAYSLGISFVDVVLDWLRLEDPPLGLSKPIMALMFPAFELLIAIGLMFGSTRKLSAYAAIGLHVSLIGILSPMGLGHRLPVVLWNALSVVLVYWIFLKSGSKQAEVSRTNLSWQAKVAVLFAIVVITGPLLRPIQLWDHWLAWGLYSPSNSRVEVFVADVATEDLENRLGDYFSESTEYPGTSEFDLAAWSLDELGAPIYPQSRFQKRAALQWLSANELLKFARVLELGPSDPWTGRRSQREIDQ